MLLPKSRKLLNKKTFLSTCSNKIFTLECFRLFNELYKKIVVTLLISFLTKEKSMKKRILIGVLSITLLAQGLSAGRAKDVFEGSRHFTTDTVRDSWRLLTARNLALLSTAYYIGGPCLNRIHYWGNNVLRYGTSTGYGIDHLSRLAAWIVSWPNWIRCKIDPRAREKDAIPERVATIHSELYGTPDEPKAGLVGKVENLSKTLFGTDGDPDEPGLVGKVGTLSDTLSMHKHDDYAPIEHTHKGFATADHTHPYAPNVHNHDCFATKAQLKTLAGRVSAIEQPKE